MDKRSKKFVGFLLHYAKWSRRMHPFLIEKGYKSLQTPGREKKSLDALHNAQTIMMASLVCIAYYEKAEPYTVRSLAKDMNGTSEKALKAMEMQIKRRLEAIENYDLLKFDKAQHQGTDRICVLIEPTEKLLEFFDKKF